MAAKRKRKKTAGSSAKARRGPASGRGGRRSPGRRLASWVLALAVWGVLGVLGLVAFYAYDLPDVRRIGTVERAPTVTLLAADGGELVTFGGLYSRPVALADLPPHLPRAVIATEDRRFYDHFGLDLIGLMRAAYVNLRAGRVRQGGSTITQQLAKNLFLTPERTLKRKVQETLLALWLERIFTKDQILTLYLNRVYLGAGTYGVEAAARKYFDRPAGRLDLPQAALIAGLLKAPTRYAPTRDLERSRRRAAQVLDNMVAAGYLNEDEAARAKRRPASLAPRRRAPDGVRYFADWVLDRVPDYVGHAARDLVVLTTLDRRLQVVAEGTVERALAGPGAKQGVGQAALLALSPDGAVRALVGGRSYARSQFNRATQARRQPGSAFKLFVYLAALEAGMGPDDVVRDEPVQIGDWRPQNYGRGHAGEVTLRQALARSINTVAVKVSERAGRDKVVAAARRLGVTVEGGRHPSIALGTAEVTLMELTAAYAALANGGAGVWSYAIVEIRDSEGTLLYRRQGSGPGRVIAPRQVAKLNEMLAAVLTEGTGKAARLDRPAGGKTGTSQQFRDAWFVGYTAQFAAGVWVGNDDASPMRQVTGGGLPARIWRDFMAAAHAGLVKRPLAPAPASKPTFLERLFAGAPSGEREREVR